MNDKDKLQALKRMPREARENILNNLAGPEALPRTPERPLGGMVHISGIGQVTVGQIENSLKETTHGT